MTTQQEGVTTCQYKLFAQHIWLLTRSAEFPVCPMFFTLVFLGESEELLRLTFPGLDFMAREIRLILP